MRRDAYGQYAMTIPDDVSLLSEPRSRYGHTHLSPSVGTPPICPVGAVVACESG